MAGPIGTGVAPFDVPELMTDDGASFRVISATCHCANPCKNQSEMVTGQTNGWIWLNLSDHLPPWVGRSFWR